MKDTYELDVSITAPSSIWKNSGTDHLTLSITKTELGPKGNTKSVASIPTLDSKCQLISCVSSDWHPSIAIHQHVSHLPIRGTAVSAHPSIITTPSDATGSLITRPKTARWPEMAEHRGSCSCKPQNRRHRRPNQSIDSARDRRSCVKSQGMSNKGCAKQEYKC